MVLDVLLQIKVKTKSCFSLDFGCFFHNRNFLDFGIADMGIAGTQNYYLGKIIILSFY